MRLAALRRALLPAAAAAAFLSGAPAAGAQTVGALYAPGCGPGTSCTQLRFQVTNLGASALAIDALTLTATAAPFRFAPAAGGVALYEAVDAVGPFGGTAAVAPGGAQLFVDFLGGNGFAFELAPATDGYVAVPLTQTPFVADGAFTFAATLAGGRVVTGSVVALVPEPATVALLGGGLALVGAVARRRRAA